MELKDITKPAVTISQNATFEEVITKMVREQTNSVIVVDEDGAFAGEVSVPDLMDAIVPEYLDGDSIAANFATEEMFEEAVRDAASMQVKEFMGLDTEPVRADEGLMSVAATAIAHQRASIPIVDHDNRPVGVISRRGLKHIIAKFLDIADSA